MDFLTRENFRLDHKAGSANHYCSRERVTVLKAGASPIRLHHCLLEYLRGTLLFKKLVSSLVFSASDRGHQDSAGRRHADIWCSFAVLFLARIGECFERSISLTKWL